MSNARRFAKNSLALTTASLSVAVLGAVYRIYIAKYLGQVDFGKYLFIVTAVAYGSILSLLGLRQVIVREVAKSPERHGAFLRAAFRIRLFTTSSAFAVVCLTMLLLDKSSDVKLGLVIFGLSMFPQAGVDIMESMFIAAESAIYVTITNVGGNLLKILIGIYLLVNGYGLLPILWLFTAITCLNLLVDWAFFRRLFGKFRPVDDMGEKLVGRFLLLESLPFFYILLISKVYYKNDVMVLSLLKGDKIVGGYGAAYMPVDFLLLASGSIVSAAYPVMSRIFSQERERLSELQAVLCRYLMMLFLPVAIILAITGPELVSRVFGAQYVQSAPALRILAWIPPAEAVTVAMGMLLGTTYNQKLSAKIALLGAALCLCFNLLLIPKWGTMGAGAGTVAAVYVNMLVSIFAVNRSVVKLPVVDILARPAASCAVALLAGYAVNAALGQWLTVFIVVIMYLALLLVTGSLTRRDYQLFRSMVARGPGRTI